MTTDSPDKPTILELLTMSEVGRATPGLSVDEALATARNLVAAGAVEQVGDGIRHVPAGLEALERISPDLHAQVTDSLRAKLGALAPPGAGNINQQMRNADQRARLIAEHYGADRWNEWL